MIYLLLSALFYSIVAISLMSYNGNADCEKHYKEIIFDTRKLNDSTIDLKILYHNDNDYYIYPIYPPEQLHLHRAALDTALVEFMNTTQNPNIKNIFLCKKNFSPFHGTYESQCMYYLGRKYCSTGYEISYKNDCYSIVKKRNCPVINYDIE